MYQALYRKYRPKSFDDVVGQDVVIRTLKNSILNNKISHAYLFSGPRGCGKTSIAKIFAKLVNCQNLDGTNLCNKCVCCTQSDDQNLDIIEMDAASNNGVDEIREINNKVNLVPSIGKYKVYIIDEVHMLTIGAFNALLKTLEEPPSHVIFILATTDPHKVPITILSRCQKFDFKKISEEKICEKIKFICSEENISIEEEAIKKIAYLGDGSLRDTLSILDQVISYAQDNITLSDVNEVNGTISEEEISSLINTIIDEDLTKSIELISEYNNKGKSIIRITEEIILFLRNIIVFKNKSNSIYNQIANSLNNKQIIEYIEIFNNSLLDMKKFTNSKMMLELAFIRILSNSNINYNNEKNDDQVIDSVSKELKKDFPGNYCEEKDSNKEQKVICDLSLKTEINNMSTDTSKLSEFIDIRVSNTLANFSKKQTIELKEKICKLNDYILDDKYGENVSLILDGDLKAVGKDNVIFSYSTSNLVNIFNGNLLQLENVFKELLNQNIKLVAVDLENWNQIKEDFNLKRKSYIYQEEKIKYENIVNIKQNDDNIQSLFGELVEYN